MSLDVPRTYIAPLNWIYLENGAILWHTLKKGLSSQCRSTLFCLLPHFQVKNGDIIPASRSDIPEKSDFFQTGEGIIATPFSEYEYIFSTQNMQKVSLDTSPASNFLYSRKKLEIDS